jgi:hypothetical protein
MRRFFRHIEKLILTIIDYEVFLQTPEHKQKFRFCRAETAALYRGYLIYSEFKVKWRIKYNFV